MKVQPTKQPVNNPGAHRSPSSKEGGPSAPRPNPPPQSKEKAKTNADYFIDAMLLPAKALKNLLERRPFERRGFVMGKD
ncbi:MAG TPA: hypothetical protein VJP40_09845 [bacterium]|nr:hypothetical protein [bacterium]